MVRRHRLVGALVTAAMVVSAGAASAERVAVLDVVVTGVPSDARQRFEARVVEGLAGAGFEVVPRERVAAAFVDADVAEGCFFGPCLERAARRLTAAQGLVARIAASGSAYSYVLTMVDMRTGAPIRQVTDTCAVCTLDEALAAATLATVALASGEGPELVAGAVGGGSEGWGGAGRWRRAAIVASVGVGLAVASLAAGLFLLRDEEEAGGWAAVGAGVGLGAASLTFLFLGP